MTSSATPAVYHRPRTLTEALELLADHADARPLAGGTDLFLGAEPPPPFLVSLRQVEELSGIEGGRIGALTTASEIAQSAEIERDWPVLAQAASRLGSEQIRNVATIGGNLCRAAPCADTAPPLLVYEAHVDLVGPRGSRELPASKLFLGPGVTCLEPGELLTAIRLPEPRPQARGIFLKKTRVRMDLTLASVAILLEEEGGVCKRVRIAAGSVAPVPMRLKEVEEQLEGQKLTPEVLDAAASLAARTVLPISDVRTTEAYRRHITEVYVRRGLRQLLTGETR